MEISNLPIEILLLVPQHLHRLEDLVNLSSTCRKFYAACSTTSPRAILRLAAASSRTFFRPDPHFLIAATVRQVSDWALLNSENTETLHHAMQEGVYSLLALCVDKAQLSMDDIRRLHATRFSLINPLSDMIDRCAGTQWYAAPDFWNGGVSDPNTISLEPTRSLFQIAIYGELFASSMSAFLEPELGLPRFDHDFRMDYIKYCIPDPMCGSYEGMTVLAVGPYIKLDEPSTHNKLMPEHNLDQVNLNHVLDGRYKYNKLMPEEEFDQVGLNHLLRCRTWTEAWSSVREEIGPDFEEEWRQQMWHSAVQLHGLEGLEMLRPGGVEKWRSRLEAIRNAVERMEARHKPKEPIFGRRQENRVWESPNMAAEVNICLQAYWGAT